MLPYSRKCTRKELYVPRNETGVGRRPMAIKNHFALNISLSWTQETSLCPKNLPPRSHNFHQLAEKSWKKSSEPRQPAPVLTESGRDTHRPGPPSGGGCGVGWATLAPESSGSGGARPARSDAGTAPASAPLPTTANSGRREQRKRGTMLGRAGDSARSAGPQHPFRLGPPAASPSLLLRPPFTAGAAKRRPLATRSLAATAFLPLADSGSLRTGGAREGRRVREGRGRARKEPGARGSEARGVPRGPAAAPAGFRFEAGTAPRSSAR